MFVFVCKHCSFFLMKLKFLFVCKKQTLVFQIISWLAQVFVCVHEMPFFLD